MNPDMSVERGTPCLVSPGENTYARRMWDSSVFQEVVNMPPVSPRLGPTPGIILTVEDADVISVAENSGYRSNRSSRRGLQGNVQRSPSSSRMRRNASNSKLREPTNGSGVSRSQSMRTAKRPQSADPSHRFRQRISSIPNDMSFPLDGPDRLASNQSLPLPGDESDVLRLRNFAVTSKGVVNRGDSFRSKSRSAHSVSSMVSGHHQATPVEDQAIESEIADSSAFAAASSTPEIEADQQQPEQEEMATGSSTARYRVLVVGPPEVGKTALTLQFMTSEYICSYDSSQDEENEKSVTVVLNGEESELVFMEHTFLGDPVVNFCSMYSPDAYLVVYSVISKRSLLVAKEILRFIEKWDNTEMKPMILVGNKTDLVRHRVIPTEDGRSLAVEECCKFIETSAGINHQVDELLVGILAQIRLKRSSVHRALQKRESVSLGKIKAKCVGCPGCKAKGFIKRFLKKACSRTKSCDNLHVL